VSALLDIEGRIAESIAQYIATPSEHRANWVRAHFGGDYPDKLDVESVLSDVVARAVNSCSFKRTHSCPTCGRIALEGASAGDVWSFYSQDVA
jgi:hypothetical protein